MSSNTREEYNECENKANGVLHIHFFHRHISAYVAHIILILFLVVVIVFSYSRLFDNPSDLTLPNNVGHDDDFIFGAWPALEDADFFQKTRNTMIDNKISFMEADLTNMKIRFYKDGILKKEADILSKGREGSWWETPAGVYKIGTKEVNHFSSFGRVNMPYSMQFQGNFFVHGPTTYPDGTPTPPSYSGGCIRVNLKDMKEIYDLAKVGTPLVIFEENSSKEGEEVVYGDKILVDDDVSYIAVDLQNNFVFAGNRTDEVRSIASITKLVTALVAVEYINVEKEVYISESELVTTSISRLKEGDIVEVLDLLSLLLMESSNEAALAITKPLGERNFINLMNVKADAIGMDDSHFVDTSGVLSGDKSTAEDLFRLGKYLYYNRSFVLQMTMGVENRIAYGPKRYPYLQNFNDIYTIRSEVGGKTGLSSSAGDSMLMVVEMDIDGEERPVAVVVLGSEDAKADIVNILDYIESRYVINKN